MKIAHIINPVKVSPDNPSYLFYTQPLTFKSMYESKLYAESNNNNLSVYLYTINYPEDNEIIPDYFIKLPYLSSSTLNSYSSLSKKKLPFIQEIFDSIIQNVHADYIIYTNSDIIVHQNFYNFITKYIYNYFYDFMIINRRDNIPKFINNIRLDSSHLNLIFSIEGEKHPGKDCFVIKKSILKKINMKNMFIAYPPWGKILTNYLIYLSNNYKIFVGEYLTYHLGNDNNHDDANKQNKMTKQNFINAKEVEKQFKFN